MEKAPLGKMSDDASSPAQQNAACMEARLSDAMETESEVGVRTVCILCSSFFTILCLLTLQSCEGLQCLINPRHACAAKVTVVGLSVCLSVSRHLTSGASVRLEHAVTYSMGNEGQKMRGGFL